MLLNGKTNIRYNNGFEDRKVWFIPILTLFHIFGSIALAYLRSLKSQAAVNIQKISREVLSKPEFNGDTDLD